MICAPPPCWIPNLLHPSQACGDSFVKKLFQFLMNFVAHRDWDAPGSVNNSSDGVERFEIATGIDAAGDNKRVCILLSIIGDAVKVFDTFEYGDGESEDSIQDVLNKFEEYCKPRRNTIYERYKFQCRHQEGGW